MKQELAKATQSVRNKFRQLRSSYLEENRLLEQQYKPIIKRLSALIETEKSGKKVSSIASPTRVRAHNSYFAHSTPAKRKKIQLEYFSDRDDFDGDDEFVTAFADNQVSDDSMISQKKNI